MPGIITDDAEEQTSEIEQSLDEFARERARRMVRMALDLEVEQYVQGLHHL